MQPFPSLWRWKPWIRLGMPGHVFLGGQTCLTALPTTIHDMCSRNFPFTNPPTLLMKRPGELRRCTFRISQNPTKPR